MSKLYNTNIEIVNNFHSFFSKFSNSKTLLNFLPHFFFSLIDSESSTSSKISLSLFKNFNSNINLDSFNKRIYRFLNNQNYNLDKFFLNVIDDTLSRFKLSHSDNNIFITFDHMFVKNKFVILMFSLRIGKQSIPLYFYVAPGTGNPGFGSAFKSSTIKKGLKFCHDLIKKYLPDSNIIFLADRWFGNLFPLMNFINKTLNDKFVFRCKQNLKVLFKPNNENHKIWIDIVNLPHYSHCSKLFSNLIFTKNRYKFNLSYCKSVDHQESWLLITNCNPKLAKKFYGYRFGSIEFLFKSQKSNGFYLEETGIKNLHAFVNLYSLICTANLFLTCLGTDISKNFRCYKNLGFRTTRKNNKTGAIYRSCSRFRSGLILFKMSINSSKKFRLPITFTLYDS